MRLPPSSSGSTKKRSAPYSLESNSKRAGKRVETSTSADVDEGCTIQMAMIHQASIHLTLDRNTLRRNLRRQQARLSMRYVQWLISDGTPSRHSEFEQEHIADGSPHEGDGSSNSPGSPESPDSNAASDYAICPECSPHSAWLIVCPDCSACYFCHACPECGACANCSPCQHPSYIPRAADGVEDSTGLQELVKAVALCGLARKKKLMETSLEVLKTDMDDWMDRLKHEIQNSGTDIETLKQSATIEDGEISELAQRIDATNRRLATFARSVEITLKKMSKLQD